MEVEYRRLVEECAYVDSLVRELNIFDADQQVGAFVHQRITVGIHEGIAVGVNKIRSRSQIGDFESEEAVRVGVGDYVAVGVKRHHGIIRVRRVVDIDVAAVDRSVGRAVGTAVAEHRVLEHFGPQHLGEMLIEHCRLGVTEETAAVEDVVVCHAVRRSLVERVLKLVHRGQPVIVVVVIVGRGVLADQRVESDRPADDDVVAATTGDRVTSGATDQPVVAGDTDVRTRASRRCVVADQRVVASRADDAVDLERWHLEGRAVDRHAGIRPGWTSQS